jgi:hypothetical protein
MGVAEMKGVITIAVLFAATAAQAQTTTNCSALGGEVTCNTGPNGFYLLGRALAARRQHDQAAKAFVAALQAGRCVEAQTLAAQFGDANDREVAARCVTPEAAQVARANEAEQALLKTISMAVKEGRCDAAKAAALDASRLDLADQVVRICTPNVAVAAASAPRSQAQAPAGEAMSDAWQDAWEKRAKDQR